MKQTSLFSLATLLTILVITACNGAQPAPTSASETQPELTAVSTQSGAQDPSPSSSGTINIKAEVWADNWFAFYSGDQLVKEDSVSITTERSFNVIDWKAVGERYAKAKS